MPAGSRPAAWRAGDRLNGCLEAARAQTSTSVVEPYNSVLTTHTAMEHADVTFLVDNDAVFSICKNKMEVARSSYRELNQLISQVTISSHL